MKIKNNEDNDDKNIIDYVSDDFNIMHFYGHFVHIYGHFVIPYRR